jgi:plastocyanin
MSHTGIALLALTLIACGQGGYGTGPTTSPPPGNDRTVTATPSLAFGPSSLTIRAGEAVTFDFGAVAHNVFFDEKTGAPADISGTNANVAISRTFETPGTYRYTCHIHPAMQGTIVVE